MTDNPGEILLALGRLEGKVDALMTQQMRTQEDMDSLERRVRTLEGSKAILVGICTTAGAGASYLVTLLK